MIIVIKIILSTIIIIIIIGNGLAALSTHTHIYTNI